VRRIKTLCSPKPLDRPQNIIAPRIPGKTIIAIIIVLAILLITHFIAVYFSLFENQIAFIYHPPTDSFFVVDIKPIANPIFKWRYLNPFKSIKYGQVDYISYIGKLSVALRQMERFCKTREDNSKIFSQKLDEIERKDYEQLQEFIRERDFSYIYCWRNLDIDPKPLIPQVWKNILANIEKGDKGGLFVADVIYMRVTKNGPCDVMNLHNSLVVYPPASAELINQGFNEYIMFDEIW
jgi:hypothetical protein